MGRETYAHTHAEFLLTSCKGTSEFIGTYAEARDAARKIQAELQASYGVTVSRRDDPETPLYTAN